MESSMKFSLFIKSPLLLGLVFLLGACEPNNKTAEEVTKAPGEAVNLDQQGEIQEDQRLAAFFDEVFERDVSQSPEFQAYLGRKTDDYGRWSDYSEAWAVFENEQTAADLERLYSEFNFDALNETSKISYRIFEFLQERAIQGFDYRFHGYAFSTMNNPSTFPATFLQNIHSLDNVSDAEVALEEVFEENASQEWKERQLRQAMLSNHSLVVKIFMEYIFAIRDQTIFFSAYLSSGFCGIVLFLSI